MMSSRRVRSCFVSSKFNEDVVGRSDRQQRSSLSSVSRKAHPCRFRSRRSSHRPLSAFQAAPPESILVEKTGESGHSRISRSWGLSNVSRVTFTVLPCASGPMYGMYVASDIWDAVVGTEPRRSPRRHCLSTGYSEYADLPFIRPDGLLRPVFWRRAAGLE